MTLLIFLIIFTLVGSFLCSLLEAVILSVTQTYIQLGVQAKRKSAFKLQYLKANIDRPLAAILTFNTVCNTMGAAGIGVQVLNIWGQYYVAFASAGLTFFILVFSEIIPKTLGASRWRALAPFSAYAITALIYLLYPIVVLSEYLSDMVGGSYKYKLTREEMIVTAEMGASHGTLNKKESTIIKNLLMLDNIYAYDIMTPRAVMLTFDWNKTIGEVMEKQVQKQPIRYSRIPVYDGDLDNIKGFVHRYKILEAFSEDKDNMQLKEMMLPLHSVPEDITVSAVLDQLMHRGEHIFITTDEYGSTMGLVTLEDAIETLLGVEIVDEFDSVADLREYALEQWKKRKRERLA